MTTGKVSSVDGWYPPFVGVMGFCLICLLMWSLVRQRDLAKWATLYGIYLPIKIQSVELEDGMFTTGICHAGSEEIGFSVFVANDCVKEVKVEVISLTDGTILYTQCILTEVNQKGVQVVSVKLKDSVKDLVYLVVRRGR